MKVALAGTIVGRGGIQTHFFWLSRALLEAGHEVILFSLGSSPAPDDLARLESLKAVGDFQCEFPYHAGGGVRRSTVAAGVEIRRRLRALRPEVYLACGTGWNLFLPALASVACRRRVFHEVMSGVAGNYRDSRWAVRHGFHEVVAQASRVARNFERTFRWPGTVPVLPAFPEPLEITAQLPIITGRRVPLGRAKAALFSRLVPHKQALWLVRQWPALASHLAELHVFGTGPEEPLIRSLIKEQGWQERVFCHGPYPDGQAYVDLLSTFDLTLLPTIGAEGAPLVLLESMACGVPFVAFDAGGIPDYANPDCCITSMKDQKFFVSGVKQIAERLANAEINRERLQAFYRQHFSFSRLKDLWINFLESRRSG
jgi:glycosyltransferase involved in cell wall biosynthesis